MPLTLWVLILAAIAAAAYGLHRYRQSSKHASRVDSVRRKSAAEQAELDRRECLELEQALRAGAYGDRAPTDDKSPRA